MDTNYKNMVCFVLMGYGSKTDYATSKVLDLDKTFEHLIKPVFDELEINCFRACDILHSGTIDVPMYENILKADIVVADISTLNANALYELGVRHALRPMTTIVISESELLYPFDLQHTVITRYEHLGKDIGATEAKRFTKVLKNMVTSILKDPQNDSPVYTYIKDLTPPTFTKEEIRKLEKSEASQNTISHLIQAANNSIDNEDFTAAISILNQVRSMSGNDHYVVQRLALATYKSSMPTKREALLSAERMLTEIYNQKSTDIETLGMLGSVYKRLYDVDPQEEYLDKSIRYYEKGFVLLEDYYTGINLAFLLLKRASESKNKIESIADYYRSNVVRKSVSSICNSLLATDNLKHEDIIWVHLTLAEVHFCNQDTQGYEKSLDIAMKLGGSPFAITSFESQISLLKVILDKIEALKASWPTLM